MEKEPVWAIQGIQNIGIIWYCNTRKSIKVVVVWCVLQMCKGGKMKVAMIILGIFPILAIFYMSGISLVLSIYLFKLS